MMFDGSTDPLNTDVIGGVSWGDQYKFFSTSAPVTFNSTWTWNTPNTVPYVKLWMQNVDATMGIVQKIFYFHVPAAYAMYLGATACFLGSVMYFVAPTAGALVAVGACVCVQERGCCVAPGKETCA